MKLDATMDSFPDSFGYALTRSCGQRAVLDWRRRERVQRCEGSTIEHDDHGRRIKGNTVDSFDTIAFSTETDDPTTLYDLIAAEVCDLDLAFEDHVLEGIERTALVAEVRDVALTLLTEAELRALDLVVSRGLPVIEAAAEAGVARETMGRQRDRAIVALRRAFDTAM